MGSLEIRFQVVKEHRTNIAFNNIVTVSEHMRRTCFELHVGISILD